MSTQQFLVYSTSGQGTDVYARVFNASGQVLDFNDNTFKSLGSATTPYKTATERGDMGGTGESAYTVDIDLSLVNKRAGAQFYVRFYSNSSPLTTDVATSPKAGVQTTTSHVYPTPAPWVEFSELGRGHLVVMFELNTTSSEGTAAQCAVWLERNGVLIDLTDVDPSVTGSLSVREHEQASPDFTKAFTNSDVKSSRLESTQADPGLTADRGYHVTATITLNSVTFATTHGSVVFG